MIQINSSAFLIGILSVFVITRAIKSLLLELVIVGAIFTFIETYHFWVVPFFGFPAIPVYVSAIIASAQLTWTILKLDQGLGAVGIPYFGVLHSAIQG